jgi:Trk K+ transport system NAD-binding subunit
MKQALPSRPRMRRRNLWRLVRANLYDLGLLLNESWIVLAGFFIVTAVGTIYLWLFYDPCRYDSDPATALCRLSALEALYETTKLQTLQSGLAFPRGSIVGGLLFFLIPLLGLALIFQGVLNFGRLLLDKGSRREAWQIALASAYSNHVIVCGLGRVGMRTVDQLLEAGYDPVVIERDWSSEFVERALSLSVPVIVGDGREPLTLRRAGIQRARAVVSLISDDLLNIEIALTARALATNARIILRVFGEELDQNLERSLGRNAAFSASALAAPTYAAAAVSREIDVVIPGIEHPLGMTQLTVQPKSMLHGTAQSLEQVFGVRVVHQERSTGIAADLRAQTPINTYDKVTLIGTYEVLEAARLGNLGDQTLDRLRAVPLQHLTEQYDTVIVCGLGKVGYRVVRQLHALNPRPKIVVVRLVDGRPDFPQRIESLPGVRMVIGDAREESVLREAGIDRAFSVAALTSDDLLNLQASLAARRIRPDVHIVVRVFSEALADRLGDMFGIRTAYSTSALASPTLAAAAVVGDIAFGFMAGGRLYGSRQLQIAAGGQFESRTIGELRDREGVLVVELRRAGRASPLPPLDAQLAAGDEIMLVGPVEMIGRC